MTRQLRSKRSTPRRKLASASPPCAVWPDMHSQLAAIVENSNDAIFSRTLDGVVTTWNVAAERVFGFKASEIVGRSGHVLLPRGQREEYRKLVARIRRGEQVQHYITTRLRKDGTILYMSLTLSPVRDSRRRLIGFSTIARDVTEERRMKELLARREHELQDLFDDASIGLLLLDPAGKILRANRAFGELVNGAEGTLAGRNLRDFHPDADWCGAALAQLAARRTIHSVSTELRTRDGESRHVLVDANALWENGRFVHSRWFLRDISRRKQLEHALLEISERERLGFAQELHDGLGQQLGGVAYLSNVLREKLAERSAPEAQEALRIFDLVREAIEHTRRLSRGLSPIPPEPEGLMNALHELAAHTRGLFPVRCRWYCRKPVLLADASLAGHLYRIAQEAVNNALKHGRPRAISLRLGRWRNRITLVVADNGKGIGQLSPKRQGLGLQIMQYRAGLMGGTVEVKPRRGGGTEVVCTAPFHPPETPRTP